MYSTASSARLLPGSTPTTLRDCFCAIWLFRSTAAVAFSGTGLKPRLLASL
jgi:hypothetical protein